MFADSVLNVPWTDRSRRGYATLISFAVESLVVGGLLLMPILYVQGLPHVQWMGGEVLPAPPPGLQPEPMRGHPQPSASNMASDGRIIVPQEIPDGVAQITDESVPAPVDISQLGVTGSTGDRMARNGVFGSTGSGLNVIVPPPTVTVAAKPLRLSQVMEGYIIQRVQPEYPVLARQARIEGSVVLRAIISREGNIENLQVLSGHPMLAPAAINAVRQWRYRPYYLNGEAVEVETQVTVNFTLAGRVG